MNFNLNLNDRPFQAIKVGTKKVEGRTPKDENDKRYEEMKAGDTLIFTNNVTGEVMNCEVLFVHKYSNTRSMLEAEGVENVLSSKLDIEGGIESYNKLEGYKERIDKFGIYAIGVKVI
jgi:ASC-1-like (ASCH) protein